jgi:predicted Rossmann fold nucleotide-binding protein DprA/Smf involved in DNA uptake
MVCAISPASVNYEESLNTLRYAERAKKVKNVAVVNESADHKRLRELKDENDKLKEFINALASGNLKSLNMSDPGFANKLEELNLTGLINKSNEERMGEL